MSFETWKQLNRKIDKIAEILHTSDELVSAAENNEL